MRWLEAGVPVFLRLAQEPFGTFEFPGEAGFPLLVPEIHFLHLAGTPAPVSEDEVLDFAVGVGGVLVGLRFGDAVAVGPLVLQRADRAVGLVLDLDDLVGVAVAPKEFGDPHT